MFFSYKLPKYYVNNTIEIKKEKIGITIIGQFDPMSNFSFSHYNLKYLILPNVNISNISEEIYKIIY